MNNELVDSLECLRMLVEHFGNDDDVEAWNMIRAKLMDPGRTAPNRPMPKPCTGCVYCEDNFPHPTSMKCLSCVRFAPERHDNYKAHTASA